ncbi:hypothetical protein ACFRFH_12815 [Leifsonia sp. NPDC056824]|uniref:hypothetical protein n=1 Tax=Leifsonia sp. NPDC056824 TaxID=3345953 RepID=UPI0036A57FD0
MTQFLIVFNRLTQEASIREFASDDQELIVSERIAAELAADSNTEVAILAGASRADLERTHARYFKSRSQMMDDFGRLLAS